LLRRGECDDKKRRSDTNTSTACTLNHVLWARRSLVSYEPAFEVAQQEG
jgi:hypothetical protein